MPIQINLLSDALAAQDLRRRDPVKRAIFAGALLVALMFVWYSSISLQNIVNKSNLAKVQADIQTHTNEYNVVVSNLKAFHQLQARVDALHKLSSARFLQGNLLNALQQLYVPGVNLMSIEVAQSYTRGDADAPASAIVEHTVLTLGARDASSSPGDQVNNCKEAISQISYFQGQLNPVQGISLSNLSPPQTTMDSKPFVLFTMVCKFKDQIR